MSGVISIQGNLGAGKSTLLSMLNVNTIKEPVDDWLNVQGTNILQQYYQHPQRWAFTFQLNALHSRAVLWAQISKQPTLFFSERSPMADRYVFGEIMHREGNMCQAEYNIYDRICQSFIAECPVKAIIYLKCPAQICLQRVKDRNRKGEEGITLEYLKKVHDRHEDWLNRLKDIQILTIDTGVSDLADPQNKSQILEKIEHFIEKVNAKKQ